MMSGICRQNCLYSLLELHLLGTGGMAAGLGFGLDCCSAVAACACAAAAAALLGTGGAAAAGLAAAAGVGPCTERRGSFCREDFGGTPIRGLVVLHTISLITKPRV